MQKWTLSDYEDFFEELKIKEIVDNVYPIDIHDINVNDDIKSSLQNGTLLVIVSPEIGSVGNNVDSIMDKWDCMIFILQKVNLKASDSFNKRKEVRNDTLEVCKNIRKEILKITDNIDILCHPFKNIDAGSFKFQKMGPTFNCMYGWAMSFSFSDKI
jgi:hypothetical protein